MIKVIAVDLDGTFLNENHEISNKNLDAALRAQEAGIRFMIATGRSYKDAKKCFRGNKLICDFIVASGAQIRDESSRILRQIPMEQSCYQEILDCAEKYDVALSFCSDTRDYIVGSENEIISYLCMNTRLFFGRKDMGDEEITGTEMFRNQYEKVQSIESVDQLIRQQIPVNKIFISDCDTDKLEQLNRELERIPDIVSASSFKYNIELTHKNAQKGIALSDYSKMLGYRMDEVMAFGDSMNDYSMLSMDFGATVAMGNAAPKIKAVSKYRTLTNSEDGVAFAIGMLLEGRLEELRA